MKHIPRFELHGTTAQSAYGEWARWSEVDAMRKEHRAQLPEGMEDCTIKFLECENGHGRLWATNWIDHGCPTCAQEKLQKALTEVTAKALAATWLLVQEGVTLTDDLQTLHEEARDVLLGKDKETIAKLRTGIDRLEEALRCARIPPRPGVNAVYGVKPNDKAELRYALMILSAGHALNGGLEIEVQLP
jgi:hypothetical protein